jgi:hypothetical protein
MRYLITATRDSSAARAAGEPAFDEKLFSAYMKFNEDMHNAGVLIASEGLNPARPGAQVVVKGGKRSVVDGPFAESKELVGGFYLIEVKSLDEAVSWALRCPVGMAEADVLTIHPMTEEADLPPELVAMIRRAAPNWSQIFRARGR